MEKKLEQQPANCLRIVLFGPESTGKTTLAKQLAAHFNTEWVPEYMREYLEKKGENISKEDLIPIANGQISSENKATFQASKYLFCDTNLLELKVYCEYYYEGFCPYAIKEAAFTHRYDYYFLTDIDVPWEADNLRDRPYDRSTLFRMFEKELQNLNLPYTKLSGNKEERFEKALHFLKELKRN